MRLFQISLILKESGVFISITFAQPHFRQPMFAQDKYNWSIEQFTVGETFHYFIYVMRKGQKLSSSCKQFYCRQALSNNADRNNNNEEDSKLDGEDLNEDFLLKLQVDWSE